MHKKTKSPLDGVVSDYTLRMLFIFFTLFTLHSSLLARDALPPLVEKGEVFDPKTYKENFYIDKQSYVSSVAISKDGKTIVSGSDDNSVKIWERASGKLLKTLEGHTDPVTSVAISRDGKTIVSGSYDNSVKIWERASGKLLKSLEGHTDPVTSVVISPDGKTIVSGSEDNSVKIWDRASGKLLKSLEGYTSDVSSVAISSDGKTIVSGSNDKSVKIWERASGKLLKSLEGHTNIVSSVAISRDGKTIVSCSNGYIVKIWDRASGKLLKTLEGHTNRVNSVAISSDGKTIVSGSRDNSVKIWDRASGKLLKELWGGRNGCWQGMDFEATPPVFYRGDDGIFLYARNKSNLKPLYPKWFDENATDTLELKSKGVVLSNDSSKVFPINIKNSGKNKIYWIKSSYFSDNYTHILEQRISTLNIGEERNLLVEVDVTLPKVNPKPIFNHEVNLTLETATKSQFTISVPVSIRYAEINVTKAELSEDKESLKVTLKNVGNERMLKAELYLLKPFKADKQEVSNLEVNESREVLFKLPSKLDENAVVEVRLITINDEKHKKLPIYEWHRENVTIDLNTLAWYVYLLWALGILVLLALIFYIKRYKNATVQTFRANPKALLNATPTLLLEAKEKLEHIKEWKSTLQSANISQAKAKKVLKFYETPTKNMELFKELIEAEHCQTEGAFYRLTLAHDFKLKVDNLLVLFATDDADETFKKVKTQNEIVWVLVTEQSEKELLKLAKEKSNNMVATSQENLTRLLLSRESQEVLAEMFAKNLSFKLLSPYPTDSGVPKESSFFGRTEIIREVLSQNNNNYLIVGARQLGKTAILQALERRYADDENAECFYVTFQSQSNVTKALATVLKMQNPDNVSLDALVEYLSLRKRKAVFLLDEMDKVIKKDKEENDYLLTSTFRKLSQEGHASFVLTGFSTLYFSVTLEQESPLLNFGKLIVLDGLEKEACRELMTEPMKSMGITYENDDIIEKLIVRCGRRANLLAITCSEIIQTLDEKQKVISQSIVDAVVQKQG